MPQLANLVVNDRKTTPVAHTFTPNGIEGKSAELVESSGVPLGDKRFTITWSRANGNGAFKRTLRLTAPVVATQTVNGIETPVVVRTAYVEVNFKFDPESTLQERADAVGMVADALAASKTLVNDCVVGLQGIY